MTKQETFKKRVRARMAKTGERYAAARRNLIAQAADNGSAGRVWRSQPETGDEAVRAGTGRSWNEWVDVIEADGPVGRPPSMGDHPAIAAWLGDRHGLDGWWAQTVTGGYERIAGVRLPYQRPDGTFTASKSATVAGEHDLLRELLLSESGRAALFPGHPVELLSRPTAKAIRLSVGGGVARVSLAPVDGERVKIGVAHELLPDPEAVERWKFWWADWLAAVDARTDQD